MREATNETSIQRLPGLFFEGLRMLSGVIAVAVLGASLAWLAVTGTGQPAVAVPSTVEAPGSDKSPAAPRWISSGLPPATPDPTFVFYLVEASQQTQIANWGQIAAGEGLATALYLIFTSEEEVQEALERTAAETMDKGQPVRLHVIDLREGQFPWPGSH